MTSPEQIRAIAITGGRHVPSRKFRIEALLPYLSGHNVTMTELCPVIDRYPPASKLARPFWLGGALMERLSFLFRTRGFDVVVLQRELVSTLATFENWLPSPWVFDVDDAIYLRRNGKAAMHAAKACNLVVCGNEFLAQKFTTWNSNLAIIPTGVDTERLKPMEVKPESAPLVGWIGTSGNYAYLEAIASPLERVLKQFPQARLQIIADKTPEFLHHLGDQLDFRTWYPDIELDLLPRLSVGLMPLGDSEWARGKCAFKMLQYMAAGVPVVASPVGMNASLLDTAPVGLAATNKTQWVDALVALLENSDNAYGKCGRDLAEREYSLRVVSQKWRQVLDQVTVTTN